MVGLRVGRKGLGRGERVCAWVWAARVERGRGLGGGLLLDEGEEVVVESAGSESDCDWDSDWDC